MKIGNKYKPNKIFQKHWENFCGEINYRYLAFNRLIETLSNQIKQAAIQEKQELEDRNINHPIIDKIINFMEKNIDQTLRRFEY